MQKYVKIRFIIKLITSSSNKFIMFILNYCSKFKFKLILINKISNLTFKNFT